MMFKEFYEKFSSLLVKMRQKWTPHMNTHFNQNLQHNSVNIISVKNVLNSSCREEYNTLYEQYIFF